jgi:putative thioredoxin
MKTHEIVDFEKEVIERSREVPVVVDFWAEWCGPCKVLGPILERLEKKSGGRWVLAKLDTDRSPDLAAQYGIRGIPAVKLFVDGQVVSEFTGAIPENVVQQWLNHSLPNKYRKEIRQAESMLAEGREADGGRILEHVLEQDAANAEARVLLAKHRLHNDPEAALKLVGGIEPNSEHFWTADAIRTIATLFSRLGGGDSFPPDAVRSTYVAAVADLKARNFDDAVGKFIEVIRANREYDEDGSRKVVIAIFRLLGEEHEITRKRRREFGSALNV